MGLGESKEVSIDRETGMSIVEVVQFANRGPMHLRQIQGLYNTRDLVQIEEMDDALFARTVLWYALKGDMYNAYTQEQIFSMSDKKVIKKYRILTKAYIQSLNEF